MLVEASNRIECVYFYLSQQQEQNRISGRTVIRENNGIVFLSSGVAAKPYLNFNVTYGMEMLSIYVPTTCCTLISYDATTCHGCEKCSHTAISYFFLRFLTSPPVSDDGGMSLSVTSDYRQCLSTFTKLQTNLNPTDTRQFFHWSSCINLPYLALNNSTARTYIGNSC